MHVHPSAVIEDGATLGADVKIGPFCMVGRDVVLGDGCELVSHVAVAGRTTIGARTRIWPFASIGHQPQDLKYRGEASTLSIGADCLIREGVTVNPGTQGGGMETVIGDRCAFLANSHVGHDCRIGNNVIFSNNAIMAGHCRVEDHVILGGGAAVIQFARLGAHSIVGGMAALEDDLIPYGMAVGNRAYLAGLNLVGLKRRNFERDDINALRHAYREIFAGSGTLKTRAEEVGERYRGARLVEEVVAFIASAKDRAICTPKGEPPAEV